MPKTVDHEERRSGILAAFMRVAAREGLHAVSLRAVATEAGISLRLVQYYFGTKADLMRAGLEFLERASNMRWESLVVELPQPPVVRAVLRALVEVALPTDRESRNFHLLWMSYAVLVQTDPGLANRAIIDSPNRVLQRIEALLDRGKEAGEFHAHLNSEAEAAILLGLMHGLGTAVLVGQMPADKALSQIDFQLDRLSAPKR